MINDLEVKCRPKELDDVIGQDHIVKPLRDLHKSDNLPHKYLFYGPTGCGKTTLGRIITSLVNCDSNNVLEIDAASNNGVDFWRSVIGSLVYSSLGNKPNKAVIIDECHMLSNSSWNTLLKTLEEPPDHVYIILCTTEFNKGPVTIRGRCKKFQVKEVENDEMYEMLATVCQQEDIELNESALKLIVKNSNGCPREALSSLDQCRNCETKEEVQNILSSTVSQKELKDLFRLIAGGKGYNFKDVQKILVSIKDKNPESTRILVCNYLTKCVLGASSKEQMIFFNDRLVEWSKPIPNGQGFSDIILNTLSSIWS
jgi:DNA polymerase-3 subunit gamma/tau